MKDPANDDLRWGKGGYHSTEKMTYLETLRSMCHNYGMFGGRWHSNDFWKRTEKEIAGMTEEQAKEKVFEIENDAYDAAARWRQYQ